MVSLTALVVPIVVAAILVFVVSSFIHMVLPYHRNDFQKLADQDKIMESLRPFRIEPGEYIFPRADSHKEMSTPEFVEKLNAGPVAFMTVLPSGPPSMTGSLVQWFLYCILIGVFAGYLTGVALGPGAHYLAVFRFSGTVAFAGYGLALLQNSIWYKRAWGTTLKSVFDALIYALLSAGVFGWLWP